MEQEHVRRGDQGAELGPALVDWRRVARRLGIVAVVWIAIAAVGPLVTLAIADGAATGLWLGIGAVGLGITAVAVVARSAFAGMLRAGDRGERLAGDDVGLTPPPLPGRSRRDREQP